MLIIRPIFADNHRFLRHVTLLSIFFYCLSASGQIKQSLDSLYQTYFDYGLMEGTVLVSDSTGILYHRGFGIANHTYKIANDTATIYRVGSIEKQFTAMLILQLIDQEKLRLNTKISEVLPDYRKDTGGKVTIEHLLTQTSGIPNYTALPHFWNDSLRLTYPSHKLLHTYCSKDLEFEPGATYKYTNTNYFILGQIIERITKKPLSHSLKEMILQPTGMSNTSLEDDITPVANKASGYYRIADNYIKEPYLYVPNTLGAASLCTTTYDLYLWDRSLYTNQLLSDALLSSYTSSHYQIAPDYAYGYGWEFTQFGLRPNDTIQTMEHSGASRAFRANIFRIPKEKKCFIILSNAASQSAYDLFEDTMRVLRGESWQMPKKLLSDLLYKTIRDNSPEKAVALYHYLKKTEPDAYDYSIAMFDWLGERLLLLKNYPAAAIMFQLAVNEYPDYTYGYLYLGRAYEHMGHYQKAIESYELAVYQDKDSRPGVDAAYQINYLKRKLKP